MIEDEQENEEETGHETEPQVDTSHNNPGKCLSTAASWISENIYLTVKLYICLIVKIEGHSNM